MNLFYSRPPAKIPKPAAQAHDAEAAKTEINNQRHRGAGAYRDTIMGSGLKTTLGQ